MTTKAIRVYEILKKQGFTEDKAQEVIDFVIDTSEVKIEQELKGLVTNETFLREIGKLREEMANIRSEMANMKADLIKWNIGTMIAVAGVVMAIVRFVK